MKNKKRKIWFEHTDASNPVPVHFEPASNHLPSWYKNLENYIGESPTISDGMVQNSTVKRCAPFYDALTFGYMAILHTDISIKYVSTDDGNKELIYNWAIGPAPMKIRDYSEKRSIALDESLVPAECVWLWRWQINTEVGSSVLITHPFNRFDLPFWTTSGVMDTDSGFTVKAESALPFFLKEGFSGIIPAGTPIAQIIPFERHEYTSEVRDLPEVIKYRRVQKWAKYYTNGYRRVHRKPKRFK